MNELIIKKRWKIRIFEGTICAIGLILCIIYGNNYRYSFLYIPLLIGVLFSFFWECNHRYKEIVFGQSGITLPDGTLCKWESIRLIEFKKIHFFTSTLVFHTKNHTYEEDTMEYDFKFRRLKGYMMLNHPEIPCDSYVIELIDGGGIGTCKKRDVKVDDYVYEESERRRNKRKPKKGSSHAVTSP